ncbi:DinB family protein [Nocardioides sp. CER19]|uniref:DinB family protein n=1 Tax=Nocardioides sp. CER19 TaxID=3038538 RepID=UPI00244C9F30|nr:DinB family protein [Nocardioides sp. CER19]MDH2412839.1 DinB family protein [Nocardioides sp. CER19]
MTSDKEALLLYLRAAREAVLWKTEGLSERDLRLPRTPTGTSLIGIVKHCLNIEAGYFGPTFGRRVPMADELVPFSAYESDPQVDWYATESETAAGLIDLYRRVGDYVDATVEELPLDSRGRVPWWPPDRGEVTLHRIILHVIEDVARHAGHADILREEIDGAAGMNVRNSNVPGDIDWPAYVARLTAIAERY